MNPDGELDAEPFPPLGADLARALVFALVWSSEVTARFSEPSLWGRVSVLIAALGCTALTLGAVGIVTRGRAPTRPRPRPLPVILAGLLASGPVAKLARVLQGKTHHRALGGVTFALIAAAIVVAAAVVVRRVLGPPGRRARPRFAWVGVSMTTTVVISAGVAMGPLVYELGAGGSAPGRWLAQDLAIGVVLSGLMVVLPRIELPSRVAVTVAAVWATAVGAGALLVASNMPLRAILSEHAPVALGFIGGL